MDENNQFTKIRFIHDGEVLTDVQHRSVPRAKEVVTIRTDSGVVLEALVDSVEREYTKSFRNMNTHNSELVVSVYLTNLIEFNVENDGV